MKKLLLSLGAIASVAAPVAAVVACGSTTPDAGTTHTSIKKTLSTGFVINVTFDEEDASGHSNPASVPLYFETGEKGEVVTIIDKNAEGEEVAKQLVTLTLKKDIKNGDKFTDATISDLFEDTTYVVKPLAGTTSTDKLLIAADVKSVAAGSFAVNDESVSAYYLTADQAVTPDYLVNHANAAGLLTQEAADTYFAKAGLKVTSLVVTDGKVEHLIIQAA